MKLFYTLLVLFLLVFPVASSAADNGEVSIGPVVGAPGFGYSYIYGVIGHANIAVTQNQKVRVEGSGRFIVANKQQEDIGRVHQTNLAGSVLFHPLRDRSDGLFVGAGAEYSNLQGKNIVGRNSIVPVFKVGASFPQTILEASYLPGYDKEYKLDVYRVEVRRKLGKYNFGIRVSGAKGAGMTQDAFVTMSW